MSEWTLGIIGCGNMGTAIAGGVKPMVLSGEARLILSDKDTVKASTAAEALGALSGDPVDTARKSDIIIIAVKPQDADDLIAGIKEAVSDNVIISVMAGVRMATLAGKFGRDVPIARVMPNMAAVYGESMTCISYNGLVTEKERIENIFRGIGRVAVVDENAMDAVTAVSGSGPAYFFYMTAAMIEAGKELGLESDIARELAVQTFYGAARLIRENNDISPEDLISRIASKGGTTEAALSFFSDNNMDMIIRKAVYNAKQRSQELS